MRAPKDLCIYTDEDGSPWLAFVWGAADAADVAPLITLEAVEQETGWDADTVRDLCSWPPVIKTYWLTEADGEWDYALCAPDCEGARQITGHRFYPQE